MNYIKYNKNNKEVLLPIVVNFAALRKFQTQTKVQYNDIEAIIADLDLLENMFWYSLESGAKASGEQLKINREECEDVLNECFGDFIKIFMEDVVKIFTPAQSPAPEVAKKK